MGKKVYQEVIYFCTDSLHSSSLSHCLLFSSNESYAVLIIYTFYHNKEPSGRLRPSVDTFDLTFYQNTQFVQKGSLLKFSSTLFPLYCVRTVCIAN